MHGKDDWIMTDGSLSSLSDDCLRNSLPSMHFLHGVLRARKEFPSLATGKSVEWTDGGTCVAQQNSQDTDGIDSRTGCINEAYAMIADLDQALAKI